MTDKYKKVIDAAVKSIDSNRIERLKGVQKKIDDFKSRGLLKKQEYTSSTTSDSGRQYFAGNKHKKGN